MSCFCMNVILHSRHLFAPPSVCPLCRSYLREAEQARGKERLNLLAEHVLDVWLWTLAQVSHVTSPNPDPDPAPNPNSNPSLGISILSDHSKLAQLACADAPILRKSM